MRSLPFRVEMDCVGLFTDVIDDGFNGMIVKIAGVEQILRMNRFSNRVVKM
jgi:hypothetical protein